MDLAVLAHTGIRLRPVKTLIKTHGIDELELKSAHAAA
jgi:hypothetical protein